MTKPHVREEQRKSKRTAKSERKPFEGREEQHKRENLMVRKNAMRK